MNDFTKEELELMLSVCLDAQCNLDHLEHKLQSMIDNYGAPCELNAKWIAKAHLTEAESLIHHAKCLLGMDNE